MNATRREFLRAIGRIGAIGALTALVARLALCRGGGAAGRPLPCAACGLSAWCPDSNTATPMNRDRSPHA